MIPGIKLTFLLFLFFPCVKLITLISFSLKCSISLSGFVRLGSQKIQTNSAWCRLCCRAHPIQKFLAKERGIPRTAEVKVGCVPIEMWAQRCTGMLRPSEPENHRCCLLNERTPVENRAMRIWYKICWVPQQMPPKMLCEGCFTGHCVRLWEQHWLSLHWAPWLQPTTSIWGKLHLWGYNKGTAFKTRNLTAVELIAGKHKLLRSLILHVNGN